MRLLKRNVQALAAFKQYTKHLPGRREVAYHRIPNGHRVDLKFEVSAMDIPVPVKRCATVLGFRLDRDEGTATFPTVALPLVVGKPVEFTISVRVPQARVKGAKTWITRLSDREILNRAEARAAEVVFRNGRRHTYTALPRLPQKAELVASESAASMPLKDLGEHEGRSTEQNPRTIELRDGRAWIRAHRTRNGTRVHGHYRKSS